MLRWPHPYHGKIKFSSRRTKFYLRYSAILFIMSVTPYLLTISTLATSDESFPTTKYTCYMEIYLLYGNLPAIWKYTCYMEIYLLYGNIPAIWKYTCYMEIYLLYGNIPAIWKYTCYMEIYLLYGNIPAIR